ncbi:MAG: hypothetical protein LBR19_00945 [Bifidobacteriaceae bacterium]|jgi:hypothetical protein|nr:hypothetical protein [Bifidobacteriaceae bacterium]
MPIVCTDNEDARVVVARTVRDLGLTSQDTSGVDLARALFPGGYFFGGTADDARRLIAQHAAAHPQDYAYLRNNPSQDGPFPVGPDAPAWRHLLVDVEDHAGTRTGLVLDAATGQACSGRRWYMPAYATVTPLDTAQVGAIGGLLADHLPGWQHRYQGEPGGQPQGYATWTVAVALADASLWRYESVWRFRNAPADLAAVVDGLFAAAGLTRS